MTALGFASPDLANYSYQVSLFDAGGNQLATTTITLASSFYNQTYYGSITPVDLIVGNTYYMEAFENGPGNYFSGYLVGGSYGGSYAVNPDITYLSSAFDFISGPQGVDALPNVYPTDVNFEFVAVPEPSVLCLGATGFLALAWRRRR